jgi:hypothetical protein
MNSLELECIPKKFKIIPEYKILISDIKFCMKKYQNKTNNSISYRSLTNIKAGHINSKEITMMLENILNHNYFRYEGKFCKPSKGRATRSPILKIILKSS